MNPRELLIEPIAYMPPAHSVAEIVAHLGFWQQWVLRRCHGSADPMPVTAKAGWPDVALGSWPTIHKSFLDGLETAAALGHRGAMLDQHIAPAIEFPPLASYTLRDALVHIANHNSHHLGQVVTIRQLLGVWPPPSGSYTW